MKIRFLLTFTIIILLALGNNRIIYATDEANYDFAWYSDYDTISINNFHFPTETLIVPNMIQGTTVNRIDIDCGLEYPQVRNLSIPETIDQHLEDFDDNLDRTVPEQNFLEHFPNLRSLTVSVLNPNYMSDGTALYSKDGTILYGVCPGVTSYTVPIKVKKINPGALHGLSNLETIYVSQGNVSFKVIKGALCSRSGKTLYLYPRKKPDKKYKIPSSVKTVRNGAFQSTQFLTEINTANVSVIKEAAFADSVRLKKVITTKKLRTIGCLSFNGSKKLRQVVLKKGLIEIIGSAFSETAIKELTIPSSVIDITGYYEGANLPYSQLKTLIVKSKNLTDLSPEDQSNIVEELSQRKTSLKIWAYKGSFYYHFFRNKKYARLKKL